MNGALAEWKTERSGVISGTDKNEVVTEFLGVKR